ncbi:MAG: hypothetical protein JO291_16315 [Acidimicrobiia bacterium]|nr:hypothetical protein [Acidimicrobiia bacterium]
MTIGVSILIAATGAILRYAVADHVNDVNLAMIGLILMIAGAVGFVVGIVLSTTRRRATLVTNRPGVVVQRTYDEPVI